MGHTFYVNAIKMRCMMVEARYCRRGKVLVPRERSQVTGARWGRSGSLQFPRRRGLAGNVN
jgi:hypothetical protein